MKLPPTTSTQKPVSALPQPTSAAAKNVVALQAAAKVRVSLDSFAPAALLDAPRSALGSIGGFLNPMNVVRGALDKILGASVKDQVGWIQNELPKTTDRTADFRSIYSAAKAGETVLPGDAKDHIYLTLRGYTGDNFPTYMKENREGLSRRGLDVREVKTDTEQTVEHNAKVIRDAVLEAAKGGRQVVLIGHSKGGMDMTAAVAMYPEIKEHVRAAVAMQSPYGGVPVASDIGDQRLLSGIAGKTIEWVLRGDEDSLPDFSYENRRQFVEKYPWPSEIPTVSLATSSDSQFNGLTPVINWYKVRYGEETDGVVAQRDSEIPGSRVVRLDNLDHLNSVMPEFLGRANWDPGLLTESLVALALQK
jgi:hypothetical protein